MLRSVKRYKYLISFRYLEVMSAVREQAAATVRAQCIKSKNHVRLGTSGSLRTYTLNKCAFCICKPREGSRVLRRN